MATNYCGLCDKSLKSNHYVICCCLCGYRFHSRCLSFAVERQYSLDYINNYFCEMCNTSLFPFNHIECDNDFINVLLHFFNDFPLFKSSFSKHQLEIINMPIINNDDIDPDINIYDQFVASSNYYLPNDVSNCMTNTTSGNVSVLHLNARSLIPKLDQLGLLLNNLNIDLDIIAVSETWESDNNKHLLYIPGNHKISKFREGERIGGGLPFSLKIPLIISALTLHL